VALADNDLRAATTPAAPPDFGGAGRER
jgi:hypothetical protein